jgi:hypothetical protein
MCSLGAGEAKTGASRKAASNARSYRFSRRAQKAKKYSSPEIAEIISKNETKPLYFPLVENG